ncbi:hypothetical protein CPB85DRAFT_162106 [Mucidula mucida]|nr:hypothetical protein CPB85DRAFT_162106 [Mucidula mucida]
MAKPKKAPKVNKTQIPSKKAPNPPPSPPPPPTASTATTTASPKPSQSMSGPAKASPKPQPTLSKADQVRDIWHKFFTAFYNPVLERWMASDDDDEEKFRTSIRDAWAKRLQEQGLEEQDWSDITPAEQVAVYDAFFGVVCDEKDIASIEANMKTAPQPQPSISPKSSSPSSSPPQPIASTSSHSLVSPAPAMTPSLSSSSTYATVNPASFGYDAEDSEESEFAFFEAISDGAISTPISPSSLSSNNWWTSDSLQTSPSTSPSSKPVMVDFPVSAHHMLEDR